MTAAQGLIFDQPSARLYDPPTAQKAAKGAAEKAETHRQYALRVLRNHPEGLTDFALAEICNIQQTSIGKRRLELVRAGLVIDSGRRRPSPSGSMAIVWRALP